MIIPAHSTLWLPEVEAVLERLHILADEVSLFSDQLAPYLDYVRNPQHDFVSVALPVGDGIEYSLKL